MIDLGTLPLVAILRGVQPDEAADIGAALVAEGFGIVEVPLNSPQPLVSIARLAESLNQDVLVGAGTVRAVDDVACIADAGGRLIVMPHSDARVIAEAKRCGLDCVPGVATPTEAFAALDAGADGLKMFPAEALPPQVLKAWRAVLPKEVPLLPVGGISPDTMAPFVRVGASGFGLGSALYKPGMTAETVTANARAFVTAWRDLQAGS
ncbi:MAG: 2-dehydro-3-deoxy-6-phosphogalactonate aldolase [Alphaproteobacteria bacterium]|jgi:2-dehydro-3-deoxyphosphogalactonate aldolase|nr:2-dehydro-3-deoxy-6-phosphogalactonate aldolase [Alphaproteobacteria bacterium]